MAQKIEIPQAELDKIQEEVAGMDAAQSAPLAHVYLKQLNPAAVKTEQMRLREAISRKRKRLVVERARDMGILPKTQRQLRNEALNS